MAFHKFSAHIEYRGDDPSRGSSMRDWLFMAAPAGLAIYFMIEPEKFTAFVHWIEALFY